jgi:predicted MFS family arabinose efflux permease
MTPPPSGAPQVTAAPRGWLARANIPTDGASWAKYLVLGSMYMAQTFPSGFVTSVVPTIYRKQGLPLDMFWVFSLATIPYWAKWIWAPLIDGHGSERIGRRKSWFLPFTVLAVAAYLSLGLLTPSIDLIWIVVAILVMKSLFTSIQEAAIDAYTIDNLKPRERGIGAGMQSFCQAVGELSALAGIAALYQAYGWKVATSVAALLMLLFMLPSFLRREPTAAELGIARDAGAPRPSLIRFIKRPDSWIIAPLLVFLNIGIGMLLPLIGAFLIDLGYGVGEVGSLMGIVLGSSIALGSTLAVWIVQTWGIKTTLKAVAVVIVPASLPLIYISAAHAHTLPVLTILALLLPTTVTAWLHVTQHTARLWFASKTQAATDYAVGGAFLRVGNTIAAAIGGFIAHAVGWTGFFIAWVGLILLGALVFMKVFDRLTDLIERRSGAEAA